MIGSDYETMEDATSDVIGRLMEDLSYQVDQMVEDEEITEEQAEVVYGQARELLYSIT